MLTRIVWYILSFIALCAVLAAGPLASDQQQTGDPQSRAPQLPNPQAPAPQPPDPQPPAPQVPAASYDPRLFETPLAAADLTFLNQFAGKPSGDLMRDKQFRRLLHSIIPDCTFHYGWDMSLADAFDKVLKGSTRPVRIRDGRYLIASGQSGPYLAGRGFIWIDLQDGIALGGFYFHPTNGEPTPTINIFSRQVREGTLRMSQLPPPFGEDLRQWSAESRVSLLTTRYFITGANKKILLEHDEDFCALGTPVVPGSDCVQMDADAADIDLNAAYYLEQTNYVTNATAWMIAGPDQIAWLGRSTGA